MKISYNWLRDYIDFDLSAEELSEILTDCGLEVEGMEKKESVKGGLRGIVIGKVLTTKNHPNADRLTVTNVDTGEETPLHIVCGAPNVAAGQKVLVAKVGTTLHMGDKSFEIKKAKIRGERSEGMICAEDEVGLGTDHEGIMVLDEDAEIGQAAREYFQIEEDIVYEIGLTPNRSDATSHIGVARDLAAVLNQKYATDKYTLKRPDVSDFRIDNTHNHIDIEIEDEDACPRYTGITLSGVRVGESPDWLKNRLNLIGVRPINNIVDITNYVLFETGQPLHAFNADKIKGKKVIVKKLPSGTTFKTLDEVDRSLTAEDLMICNTQGGMCIAGVFGGVDSGVEEGTENVFLESACFNPASIRKTSKYHGLQTDASFRFERGADPNITEYALKRAIMLMKEVAGGQISSEIIDKYPKPADKWEVRINYKNVDRLIGKSIQHDIIKKIFESLEIEIKNEDEEGLDLLIPTFKVDVTREADLVEEILRIYGYNNIEDAPQLRSSLSFTKKPNPGRVQNEIAAYLSNNGFYEIMNNSLISSSYIAKSETYTEQENVNMYNPLSTDLNIMRQSLLHGGLESIVYNQNRKAEDLKFYEFGRTYRKLDQTTEDPLSKYAEENRLAIFLTGKKAPESWAGKQEEVNFFDLKAHVENIFNRLGLRKKLKVREEISANLKEGLIYLHKKTPLAEIGEISAKLMKDFDIKNAVFYADINWDVLLSLVKKEDTQYKEIPKLPAVRRDLSLLVDRAVKFEDIEKIAFQSEPNLLKEVNLFDIYAGKNIEEGKKSYAVSYILQNPKHTLTDRVIDNIMSKLIKTYKKEINAGIR